MSSDTTHRLLSFVTNTFGARLGSGTVVEPSSALFSNGLIDSMGLIELLAFVEREFGLAWDITGEELATLDTAERLAHEIERLQQAKT